jgi:hypothetical protein
LRDGADGLHVRYSKGYRYAAAPSLLHEAAHLDVPKHPDSKNGPFYGDIFVSSDSVVHLAFSDCVDPCGTDGPLMENYTSIPVGGTTFSPPEHASSAPFSSADAWPAIGVDHEGRAYVIWCSSSPGSPSCKLAVREPGKSSWLETTLDADAGMSRATKPTIVVAPEAVYGLWRHGDGEIWLETLSLPFASADAGKDATPAPGDAGGDTAVPDASGSTPPADSAGGCDCRIRGRGAPHTPVALVLVSLVLAALRRRNGHRSSAPCTSLLQRRIRQRPASGAWEWCKIRVVKNGRARPNRWKCAGNVRQEPLVDALRSGTSALLGGAGNDAVNGGDTIGGFSRGMPLHMTEDGGAILALTSNSFASQDQFWLVKLNRTGGINFPYRVNLAGTSYVNEHAVSLPLSATRPTCRSRSRRSRSTRS